MFNAKPLLVLATLVSAYYTVVNAKPIPSCQQLSIRKEWRNLTDTEKLDYIEAQRCLQSLPAIGLITAAKTRFDDFQALHINLTDEVHFVGQFLPWHRRLLNVHEKALREECGYTGTYPYWDWSIDVGKDNTTAKSPIYDPVYGFGGNGAYVPDYAGPFNNLSTVPGWRPGNSGGGCITDGPFANYTLSLGPGTLATNHCLVRAFDDVYDSYLSPENISSVLSQSPFETFRVALEGDRTLGIPGPHGAGHFTVGGEMSNTYSTPGDPIFWLHHGNIDRLWWVWQKQDLESRLLDISGVSSVDPPFVNVTLAFGLKMFNLASEVTIGDVMNVHNDLLCYDYV